jgi:hypothetical protein
MMMVVLHIKNDRLKHSSVRHIDFALNKLFFLHKSLDVCIFEIYLSETHNRKGSMSPKKQKMKYNVRKRITVTRTR